MTVTIAARRALAAAAALLLALTALVALAGEDGSSRARAAGAPASLSCTGASQGVITKGTVNNVANTVRIAAAGHGVVIPVDPSTGAATGKRQHKPYTFNKVADASSIGFTKALLTSENLTSCVFRYYRTNADGTVSGYYTVTLNNARLSSYSFSHASGNETESWSLTFQKITWAMGVATVLDCLSCPS